MGELSKGRRPKTNVIQGPDIFNIVLVQSYLAESGILR